MKIYLVGGAVRDALLGFPHQEKDWVVVGSTVEEMLKKGFRPVGKDFPVFLHPETHEEYALARTERKTGKGYAGFAFNASPDVTLEEDLLRRDLTINAIAQTPEGILVDPFHGQKDIQNRILRHVSQAFVEDPVRILRIGRFAARYTHLGFKVADETLQLMQQMVKSGEVDALVAERVWKEWEKALSEKNPEKFFEILSDCGAMSVLFPSFSIDILEKGAKQTQDRLIRFAISLQPLSEEQVRTLCSRYRIPTEYRDLALLRTRFQKDYQQVRELEAEAIVNLLQSVDAFRREERFEKFLTVCAICLNQEDSAHWLRKCLEATKVIQVKKLIQPHWVGSEIADRIKQARIDEISKIRGRPLTSL